MKTRSGHVTPLQAIHSLRTLKNIDLFSGTVSVFEGTPSTYSTQKSRAVTSSRFQNLITSSQFYTEKQSPKNLVISETDSKINTDLNMK
jgi:hypothetical protein